MLKQWKENFMQAQKQSIKLERRVKKAEREMQSLETEMLAWAASNAAQRQNIVSGMY